MSEKTLYKISNNKINEIRILSDDEVNLILKNSSDLIDFQKHHALIEYVILNYKALSDIFIKKVTTIKSTEVSALIYPFSNYYLESSAAVLNFLSSARTFLDHTGTNLKRSFTDNTEPLACFKKITANEFDSKFSYRFMGKLRNYVQHCGMPPLSYNLSNSYDHDKSIAESELTVFFSRDQLLKNYDSWGKNVEPQLKEQPESFPAFPLLNEFVYSLIKIYIEITDGYYFDNAKLAEDFLLRMIGENHGYQESEYIFGTITPYQETLSINTSTIPTSLFSKVHHFEVLKDLIKKRSADAYFQIEDL